MRITDQGRRAAGRWALLLAAGGGLATGGWLTADGMKQAQPPAAEDRSAAEALGPATPTRIRIPRIGVDAPLSAIGRDDRGHLATPSETDRNLAGWYHDGVSPGQVGTAVVLGHADTPQGPAVFRRLGSLRRGDLIDITRSDRHTARFAVDAVEADAKTAYPDERVYGSGADPQLRLVTCDGGPAEASGDAGALVVYAHLAVTD
ncbi:class F sortase [Kitasatospora sp. NPDC093558]|uniref:class F sortase n=1 Tax=Kitasatospora sp. NPDC093558 TaxID=3155201 RepID=UPI0034155188